jgi:signal transduction histidine kinase
MHPVVHIDYAFALLALYVGVNFLLLERKVQSREFLWFGIACLAVSVFDFAQGRIHQMTDPRWVRVWLQIQYVAIFAFIPCFYGFFTHLTGTKNRGILVALVTVSSLLVPFTFLTDLILEPNASFRSFRWPKVPVHEFLPGPLADAYFLLGLIMIVSVGPAILRLLQRERMAIAPTAAGYGVFTLAALNDVLAANGYIHTPYLLEFGLTILLLGISASLADRFARSLEEVRVLNSKMESRVLARTIQLDELNTSLAGRNAELEEALEKLEAAQVQLLQAEKMSSLGEFAAGVAHEINNPMAYVRSNLEQLMRMGSQLRSVYEARKLDREKAGLLMDGTEEILQETIDGANRIVEIVKGLRGLAHKGLPSVGDTDLHACIESAITLAAGELNGRATVEREFGTLPLIRCNATEVTQVIVNLVVNAAQAMKNGGAIRLRTSANGEWVRMEVEDEGEGIAAEHLSRIFDPFFTTKEIGRGTGLGLSITYGIVRKHRGRIEARSVPGRGTTFLVELPVAGPPDQAAGPPAEARKSA